ncbi:MAG: hypothetical protein M4579_005365 [Chaenotheca gracillima]|nr:MAG: hypothetical protein M4579_005365 [Chaenotheca gracillima]
MASDLTSSPSASPKPAIVVSPIDDATSAEPFRRHAYARANSDSFHHTRSQSNSSFEGGEGSATPTNEDPTSPAPLGLAILAGSRIKRKPVKSFSSPRAPQSSDRLLSSPEESLETEPTGLGIKENVSVDKFDADSPRRSWDTSSTLQQPFMDTPDTAFVGRGCSTSNTFRSADTAGAPPFDCKSKTHYMGSKKHWLSILILSLAVYSTIFSAIYLGLAFHKPRYGKRISSSGSLTPANASLLSALFAKTIELSFVTVVVAFLGQVLSRRASGDHPRGISIAEMSMRAWIMQPGSIFTHVNAVRRAGCTLLGVLALIWALMAMFYTTASDALVSPKLSPSSWNSKLMYGQVFTEYANPVYASQKCQTPAKIHDWEYGGSTCIEIEHAGQAYHNYLLFLAGWQNNPAESSDLAHRQAGVGMLYDNTTVQGSWIEIKNMTEVSLEHDRIVNNVTMAMPHSGVFAAAKEPRNEIMQPEDLDGLGEFTIRASVPSPAVNVLCAAMTAQELKPFIVDPLKIPPWKEHDFLNKTAVDDVFGFGEKYGRRHPFFPILPEAYQTLMNSTAPYTDSIYILAKSANATPPYSLCSLRSFLSPRCSTTFVSSMSGGMLSSRCEDPEDKQTYLRSYPDAPNGLFSSDWKNVAGDWGFALNMNDGLNYANASNERLLTQLIPTTDTLPTKSPSIAEALAAMIGCTLILGAQDAQFVHFWNYTTPALDLDKPVWQVFNASVQSLEYASGGVQRWQSIFYVVLFITFITNICCLLWFLCFGSGVTDFTDPENMFALALNSPPDERLAGSCGRGPEKKHYSLNWFVQNQDNHLYFGDGTDRPLGSGNSFKHFDIESNNGSIKSIYQKISSKRRSLL